MFLVSPHRRLLYSLHWRLDYWHSHKNRVFRQSSPCSYRILTTSVVILTAIIELWFNKSINLNLINMKLLNSEHAERASRRDRPVFSSRATIDNTYLVAKNDNQIDYVTRYKTHVNSEQFLEFSFSTTVFTTVFLLNGVFSTNISEFICCLF